MPKPKSRRLIFCINLLASLTQEYVIASLILVQYIYIVSQYGLVAKNRKLDGTAVLTKSNTKA
jgi:hypothetical protein